MRAVCKSCLGLAVGLAALLDSMNGWALDMEKLKVQRKDVFEFTEKPKATREGDKVTISFAVKDYCDATVAIEDAGGKIVRHLASGVLGKNAPQPFQKDSLKQTVVWDGKDEIGRYVDEKGSCTVRVSLGLQARFERTLYWSPHKRADEPTLAIYQPQLVRTAPEGVYVFDGSVVGQLRFFDHAGNYVRTTYPFPRQGMDQVRGLKRETLPPDGEKFPLKWGLAQTSLLTTGDLSFGGQWPSAGGGTAVSAMAVGKGKVFLLDQRLNCLAVDGSGQGSIVDGPVTTFDSGMRQHGDVGGRPLIPHPRSAEVSPDGRWIYIAGYRMDPSYFHGENWLQGVARVATEGQARAEAFAGVMKGSQAGAGSDNAHFAVPTAVACDAAGRVYVTDFLNDRIQVFSPDGQFVKTIKVRRPTQVCINPKTGEIYVFSWGMTLYGTGQDEPRVPATVTRLASLEDPKVLASLPLPLPNEANTRLACVSVDFWTDPVTIWLARVGNISWVFTPWDKANILLVVEKDRNLKVVRDFADDVAKSVVQNRPPRKAKQRLYFNPRNDRLYVGEYHLPSPESSKSFQDLIEVNPETGRVRILPIPFDAEDMALDVEGNAYLRTQNFVARYDTAVEPWREVPFDYGEEKRDVYYNSSVGKHTRVVSGISFVGYKGCMGHLGGMGVSPRGHVMVSTTNGDPFETRMDEKNVYRDTGGKSYTPRLYPGRARGHEVHVFDRHGKILYEDALPGIMYTDGLNMDRDDNLYVMAGASPILNGKPYINDATGALIKVRPPKGRILATKSPIPLTGELQPARPPDLYRGNLGQAWIEGAEWAYGGVGLDGKALASASRDCSCVANCRPALDLFARSFAPEVDRYRVAVLDANGNVIMRIGRYGNVDDGVPLIKEGGPPNPRSIGGDEVGLCHPLYLATQTDRRLFVADPGNQCIRSVKLGYHAEEQVALKDVPDRKK